jgi:hypothetical protein
VLEVGLAGLPELVKLLESRRLDRHADARAGGPPTSNLGGRFEVDPMQALVMTLAVAATVAVAPGCTANAPPRTATPSSVAQGPSEPTAHGGCGNTQVHTGPMPTWANSGFSGSPTGLPWATGTPRQRLRLFTRQSWLHLVSDRTAAATRFSGLPRLQPISYKSLLVPPTERDRQSRSITQPPMATRSPLSSTCPLPAVGRSS